MSTIDTHSTPRTSVRGSFPPKGVNKCSVTGEQMFSEQPGNVDDFFSEQTFCPNKARDHRPRAYVQVSVPTYPVVLVCIYYTVYVCIYLLCIIHYIIVC